MPPFQELISSQACRTGGQIPVIQSRRSSREEVTVIMNETRAVTPLQTSFLNNYLKEGEERPWYSHRLKGLPTLTHILKSSPLVSLTITSHGLLCYPVSRTRKKCGMKRVRSWLSVRQADKQTERQTSPETKPAGTVI